MDGIILFLASLFALVVSSNFVIDSGERIAKKLGVSQFALGFVIISIFTSLPELVVSVTAALKNSTGIAIGNVLGSNVTNILLVLGIVILFNGIKFGENGHRIDYRLLILTSLIPLVLFAGITINFLGGFVLLLTFLAYGFFTMEEGLEFKFDGDIKLHLWIVDNIVFWFGMVAVIIAADSLVTSAVSMASTFNIPESVIAVTVIAFGTSLPELAVAISALFKKASAIAVGEILGSCVVNITLVLGAAAMITPLTANVWVFGSSILFVLIANALLWRDMSKKIVPKKQGLVYLFFYLLFLLTQIEIITLF